MHIILTLFGIVLAYWAYTIYHRLYLSPIAKFPGPKLAAATFWYEFYYDIILGGKYIWKVKELHEKYGPIIRINPGGLHVIDPTFWDVMYTASTNNNRRDKWSWETEGIGISTSTLGTAPHELHKLRRSAIQPFFSKQNVRKLEPGIEERVQALTRRLKSSGESGEIVQMEYAFSAFANDVVMQYCFDRSNHHIEAPGFDPSYHNTSFNAGKVIAFIKHVPLVATFLKALPESIAMKMGEEISANIILLKDRMVEIEEVRRLSPSNKANQENKTVFHTLLQSDLPDSEKETRRLAEEAVLLLGAGTHTTSWILTVIAFHLLSNPSLLRKLREELKSVLPYPDSEAALMALEKLPLLTAVIKEGLRLGYGATARSSRIALDTSLKCREWTIPAGTPVSSTVPLTHHDESIFPDSHSFEPKRWMGPDSHDLEKFLVAFSKGSRNCLGMNLAWAEIYMCTAAIFRRFGSREFHEAGDWGFIDLFETDETDVRMVSDMFFPIAKEGSKGIRVKITVL